ncbi:hypothetical protein K413DRAFT_4693 [Clostridium sp. ASBs410]|nr:hypothetical protein K413DRAFT_4693 [Clostridium sp. ASBs410]
MRLIEEVFNFAIYELDEAMTNKFGGKYFLSKAVISDYWLNNHTAEETISQLRPYNYEGIFQTRLEAYYQANLVEMEHQYNLLKNNVTDIFDKMNNRSEIQWYEISE